MQTSKTNRCGLITPLFNVFIASEQQITPHPVESDDEPEMKHEEDRTSVRTGAEDKDNETVIKTNELLRRSLML